MDGVLVLPCERAAAREKGRATPRLVGSGRTLAIDRRPGVLKDLGGGDRPAGLKIGADLGVEVEGPFLNGVDSRGVRWSRVVSVRREVLSGLGEPFETSSSSSQDLLRLEERLSVVGSMFSASSTKMELFAERAAPEMDVRYRKWKDINIEQMEIGVGPTTQLILTVQLGSHHWTHSGRVQASKGLARGSHGECSHDG